MSYISDEKDTSEISSFVNHLRTETIVIRTHNLSFHVHRGLLEEKCSALYNYLTTPDWNSPPSESLYINTSNEVMSSFLQWLYTDTYPIKHNPQDADNTSTTTTDASTNEFTISLMHHTRTYIFAYVYQIPILRDLAAKHVTKMVEAHKSWAEDTTPLLMATRLALVTLPDADPLVCVFRAIILTYMEMWQTPGFIALIKDHGPTSP
ncbi:uncharacterized protein BO80DRAFT_445824 [Aspergillus ibericus CBS 121593]|uniref:BTB domain-containing protein n=1 Tax=Aspergillus ibericus CBS 121593 TaxID=1448316 RepID=A0A395GX04_9EURO|nr:hypothetical protein BO80DRAFT_445824 [Aspergillus ibericus CBS 121593]RAL00122.1 hypothetical protein BO80DRAFT_445824 [Aspergillus ibericus CBS 121593]